MEVDKQKLNQIYNEILCRNFDEDAKNYIGKPEEKVRALVGSSEERANIISLVNTAREL